MVTADLFSKVIEGDYSSKISIFIHNEEHDTVIPNKSREY